jgi:hypothetical protein
MNPDPKEIFMDPEHMYQGRNAAPYEVERKSKELKDYPYLSGWVCASADGSWRGRSYVGEGLCGGGEEQLFPFVQKYLG